METFYLWPDQPALSLLVLWGISLVVLWAARDAILQLIESLMKSLEEALVAGGRWCQDVAEDLYRRSRSALLGAGGLEQQEKLEKEFHRVEAGFSERLGEYSLLHRRLDDLLQQLEHDYRESGGSPPEVPGWTAAVESMAGVPNADDPNVAMILEGVRKSLDEAQRQALHAYRADTAERHGILDRMRSLFKEVRVLLESMRDAVAQAVETATRVNRYVDEYARIRDDDREAARALTYSASKRFLVSLLVVGVAAGGGFLNFQLVAPAVGALLPEGARLGGLAVASLAPLVIVGLELVAGILALDLLGVTALVPKLAGVSSGRRKLLLGVALTGLFVLSVVECVLIPGFAPAVLGFLLPWQVALAAAPLETLLESGRHVAWYGLALLVSSVGSFALVLGRAVRTLASLLPSVVDAYVSIPLRIERVVTSGHARSERAARARAEASATTTGAGTPAKGL